MPLLSHRAFQDRSHVPEAVAANLCASPRLQAHKLYAQCVLQPYEPRLTLKKTLSYMGEVETKNMLDVHHSDLETSPAAKHPLLMNAWSVFRALLAA